MQSFKNLHIRPNCDHCIELIPVVFLQIQDLPSSEQNVLLEWMDTHCQYAEGPLSSLLLLLVTRPLPRDGGMAEHHGAPESEKLPRVWTRGRKETVTRQRVSGAKSP